MVTLIELPESQHGKARPSTKQLDEAVWQAWVVRGRARDRQASAARLKAVKWFSIAALLITAGVWSGLAPYQIVVSFLVAAGALVVLFQAVHIGHYVFATVFAALVMLYNPVIPIVSFSGEWQRVVVIVSVLPFVASLSWRNERKEHDDQV